MNKFKEDNIKRLTLWLSESAFGDDPDYTDPTKQSIEIALKVHEGLEEDYCVYPNGEGGITLETADHISKNVIIRVSDEGKVEQTIFQDGKFVETVREQ